MPFLVTHRDYWRLLHAAGFVFAVVMLGIALYLQVVEFVMPCLFCVYLRLVTIAYGITSFSAVVYKPRAWGRKIYNGLFGLYVLAGIALSGYLIWLQEQPADLAGSCGQGIGSSLIHFPFGETLVLMFSAYGDCSQLTWAFWGLSLPVLSLFGFIVLFLFEVGKRLLLVK